MKTFETMVKDVPWAAVLGMVMVEVSKMVHYLPAGQDAAKTIVLGLISGAAIIAGKALATLLGNVLRKSKDGKGPDLV